MRETHICYGGNIFLKKNFCSSNGNRTIDLDGPRTGLFAALGWLILLQSHLVNLSAPACSTDAILHSSNMSQVFLQLHGKKKEVQSHHAQFRNRGSWERHISPVWEERERKKCRSPSVWQRRRGERATGGLSSQNHRKESWLIRLE